MKTTVVQCRKSTYDVYIGRGCGSVWGNPFVTGIDGTREEVIARHREWVRRQPELLYRLRELKGKRLGCWCSPKSCHGDILAELADALPDVGFSTVLPPDFDG